MILPAGSTLHERKDTLRSIARIATVIIRVPSIFETYIAVRSDWFQLCIVQNLGSIHDCYIGEAGDEICSINRYI